MVQAAVTLVYFDWLRFSLKSFLGRLAQAWASLDSEGAAGFVLSHCEAGSGLFPECKGIVDKWPFVGETPALYFSEN